MSAGAHEDAVALLESWCAPDTAQEDLRRAYLAHLRARGAAALSREGPPAHLTASCLVVDPERTRTLLVLHRKGGVWVQPGGHVEPADPSLAAAAAREVVEETGLRVQVAGLADLHHHGLGSAFGACREHLDVAFWARAAPLAPAVSSESDAVAWWPLDALPDGVVPDLPGRLAALLAGPARRPAQPSDSDGAGSAPSSTSPSGRSRAAAKPSR